MNGLTKRQQKSVDRAVAEEQKKFARLEGKTIKSVKFDPTSEGLYFLFFTDGSGASFTASGDDMTSTIFSLEEKK